MKLKVSAKEGEVKVFEGEGGSYFSWSSSKFPILGEAKVGAGRLVLHPRGYALPHYADSSKIAFLIRGSCTVGIVFPNTSLEERVVKIKEGDAIPVPRGVVSWWFNGEDSDVEMIFIGETGKANVAGEFTYFLLSGTLGVLGGFSIDLICRIYDINEEEANKLLKSQTGSLIIKLEEGIEIPGSSKDTDAALDIVFKIAPIIPTNNCNQVSEFASTVTAADLPLLETIGLSAKLVKLPPNSASGPSFAVDGEVRVTYVLRGGGRIQIVGLNGKRVLDEKVEAGDLVVVPPFFVAVEVADEEGMECFSLLTSSQPRFGVLGGNTSIWNALGPVVVQTSLGVDQDFAEAFLSKINQLGSNNPLLLAPNK